MNSAWIGLGSNLDNPVAQIDLALRSIRRLPQTQMENCSHLYRSKPLDGTVQPDYVNAVAQIRTGLTPHSLLQRLQLIEEEQGRVRTTERWGPRTIDLDILLYGNQVLAENTLTIPHYGLAERNFVLYPLAELVPDLVLPDGVPLQDLLAKVSAAGLTRLTEYEYLHHESGNSDDAQ